MAPDKPFTPGIGQTESENARARADFFREAARFTALVAVEAREGSFLVDTSDKNVGSSLFVKGVRGEMGVLGKALKTLDALEAEPVAGKTFVDAGANIGTSTVTALRSHPFAFAVACEPEPENYRVLRLNMVLNDLEGSVRALPVALSNSVGSAEMLVSATNSGAHRLVANAQSKQRPGRQLITVETLTLDAIIDRGMLSPEDVGLVWIDTQGHEGHVLEGAASLVRRGTPMVLEFHPGLLKRSGGLDALYRVAREHYTHFVDLRSVRFSQDPPFELHPSSDMTKFSKQFGSSESAAAQWSDHEPRHFTDILIVRVNTAMGG